MNEEGSGEAEVEVGVGRIKEGAIMEGDHLKLVIACAVCGMLFPVLSALSVALLFAVNWRTWRIYRLVVILCFINLSQCMEFNHSKAHCYYGAGFCLNAKFSASSSVDFYSILVMSLLTFLG